MAKKDKDTPLVAPTRPGRNGGLLQTGNPGNAGGKPGRSGRRPSAVREAAREEFAKRIQRLAMIADGNVPITETCPKCGHEGDTSLLPVTDVADLLRAHDMLGKYGLGERREGIELDELRALLKAQGQVIRAALGDVAGRNLIQRLVAEVWNT